VVLSSDDVKYGGFGNVKMQTYSSKVFDGKHYIELYVPARTCFVLKEKVILNEQPKKTTRRTSKKAETAAADAAAPAKKATRTRKKAEPAETAEAPVKKTRTRKTTKKTEA
jgi:hypothetical protein